MAINTRAYTTLAYEVGALADSATTLVPGTACKITKLPVSPVKTITDNFFSIAASGAGDQVNGVVSLTGNITDALSGRMVMMNAAFIPVLLNASLKKGDFLKPVTGGKWDKASLLDKAYAELMEDGAMGAVAWARPIEKIV